MTIVLAAFPPGQQGAAGGFAFLARTLGLGTGVAILAEIFAVRRRVVGFQPAYGEAFLVATLAVTAAAVAAAVAGGLGFGGRRRP